MFLQASRPEFHLHGVAAVVLSAAAGAFVVVVPWLVVGAIGYYSTHLSHGSIRP